MDTSALQSASDASNIGFSILIVSCAQGKTHIDHEGHCGEPWKAIRFTKEESAKSSTWREMRAIFYFIVNRGQDIKGKSLVHWTDSCNAEKIMMKGSPVPELQQLALPVFRVVREHNIKFAGHLETTDGPKIETSR